jgi:hypothetical protein
VAVLLSAGASRAQRSSASRPALTSLLAAPHNLPTSPRRLADFVAVAHQNSPQLIELANQVSQNRLDSLRRKA